MKYQGGEVVKKEQENNEISFFLLLYTFLPPREFPTDQNPKP